MTTLMLLVPRSLAILSIGVLLGCGASPSPDYDVLIRGGTVYDGSGNPPIRADVAIAGDRIVEIGPLADARASTVIDATGKAISPGFINMLSWAVGSLLEDGRGLSDIRQGVTLEVFGEGMSMGPRPAKPLSKTEARMLGKAPGDTVSWESLGDYLDHLAERGVSPNVASFVGATTVRMNILGPDDREPTEAELAQMRALVRDAMEEGALGLGSSLIYPPAFFASTEELIALASVAGEYGGMYISHMRSEGDAIEASLDELIRIAREASVPAEIYHLKVSGRHNWPKIDSVLESIEQARADGLAITANMYTYPAAATGLTSVLPPWVGEGGISAMLKRLTDPAVRKQILEDMRAPNPDWENMLQAAGAEGVLLASFENQSLQQYANKSLAEAARMRGVSPEDAAIDLILEEGNRVETMYFVMDEANLIKKIQRPWVSFGSDARALAATDGDRQAIVHPRTYGTFARVLAKYVREEGALSLPEAVHRLSGLPATNLKLVDRGLLKPGYFADVVVFDPDTVQDHATFAEPHQLATGVSHVLVNGIPVIVDGEHTGALPGKVVRGPGYTGT